MIIREQHGTIGRACSQQNGLNRPRRATHTKRFILRIRPSSMPAPKPSVRLLIGICRPFDTNKNNANKTAHCMVMSISEAVIMPSLICRLVCCFLLATLAGLKAQVSSMQRATYGSPLIDSVPKNQFPRGGSYSATIQGAGLQHVTGFVCSDSRVSGSVFSATDAAVMVTLSSVPVPEAETTTAPIPALSFTLLQTPPPGSPPLPPITSGSVTFDIISGPAPQVTSWKLATPPIKWIAAGVEAKITYLADVTSAGNVQFYYVVCSICEGTSIDSWTNTGDQFTTHWTVILDVTAPVDFATTSFPFTYGAVDGAGQGGLTGNDPLSPSQTINVPIVQMQLVDPIPDLLDGPSVTSDTSLLSSQGTIVNGIAADGVAQLLIRIAGAPPNETLSLSLAQDGGLANIGGSSTFQPTIPVTADSAGNAFALYQAPLDFARAGGIDDAVPSRTVDLNFGSADNPGVIGDALITVVRPPVVLIHGNWSNAVDDWRYFQFSNSGAVPDLFRVDYSSVLAQGVVAAANDVLPQLENVIQAYKAGAPTVEGTPAPVPAVQADLVAYSLGGLVSRALVTLFPFASSSNYETGSVHKLITLDTPHQGSELATNILASNAACRGLFSAAVGPVSQNVQDMAPGSGLLRSLATPRSNLHIPAAVIVSIANPSQQVAAFSAYETSVLKAFCPGLLPTSGYPGVFTNATNPSGESDLIVSAFSKQATNLSLLSSGAVFPIPSAFFPSVIHDVNPTLFPSGPDVRQTSLVQGILSLNYVGVPAPFGSTEQVLQWLNTPVAQFGRIAP